MADLIIAILLLGKANNKLSPDAAAIKFCTLLILLI